MSEQPDLLEPGILEEVETLIAECMDLRLLLFAFEGRVGIIAAKGSEGITSALEGRIERLHRAITQYFYAQTRGYEERCGRPSYVKPLKRVEG